MLSPFEWAEKARCKYEAPTDPYVETVLAQNIRGERCAIERYQEIADFTYKTDWVTHTMAVEILSQEVEHEKDLDDFVADINRMKKMMK